MSKHLLTGADYRPVVDTGNDPEIIPIGIILHIAVSDAASLFGWFNGPSGGIESHLYVPKRGKTEQYRPFNREADANYQANSFWRDGKRYGYISIETAGFGPGRWTRRQLRELRRIITEIHAKYPQIPLEIVGGPFAPGIGWHAKYPGIWTPHRGKTCPGARRIRQIKTNLIPSLRGEITEEDAMSVWNTVLHNFKSMGGKERRAWDWLMRIFNSIGRVENRTARIEGKVNRLLERDANALAEKVAAKVNVKTVADAEVVKAAVKEALAEGVEG